MLFFPKKQLTSIVVYYALKSMCTKNLVSRSYLQKVENNVYSWYYANHELYSAYLFKNNIIEIKNKLSQT